MQMARRPQPRPPVARNRLAAIGIDKQSVEIRRRTTKRANADDVYIHVPGHATEFRSKKQILRALGNVV